MQRSMSLVGLDVHASQTHAAVLDMATGELRGTRLRIAPGDVLGFLAGCPVRSTRCMRLARLGSGWRGLRRSGGSRSG
jgi:hypothetical protein